MRDPIKCKVPTRYPRYSLVQAGYARRSGAVQPAAATYVTDRFGHIGYNAFRNFPTRGLWIVYDDLRGRALWRRGGWVPSVDAQSGLAESVQEILDHVRLLERVRQKFAYAALEIRLLLEQLSPGGPSLVFAT